MFRFRAAIAAAGTAAQGQNTTSRLRPLLVGNDTRVSHGFQCQYHYGFLQQHQYFSSKKKRKKLNSKQGRTQQIQTSKEESARLYELDNRRQNQEKATAFEDILVKDNGDDSALEVSKKLIKCRTTKEFINYAENAGAHIKYNSNHVKVSMNGVTTGFQSPGRKEVLHIAVRKQKIEAFKAMGIAWDKKKINALDSLIKNEPQSTEE